MKDTSGKLVLVVEDEPVMRTLLGQILAKKFEVHLEENGKAALSWMYDGQVPDLVLADLNMPEINGFEFIEHLRSSGFFMGLPVIVLSGEESSQERVNCFKIGANDYLIKPFNPEELILRIDNLLRLKM